MRPEVSDEVAQRLEDRVDEHTAPPVSQLNFNVQLEYLLDYVAELEGSRGY